MGRRPGRGLHRRCVGVEMMRLTAIAFVAAMFPVVVTADPQDERRAQADSYRWSTSEGRRLGVMVVGLNPELRTFFGAPEDSGLLVAQVAPDSAAARAGIRVGDVITRLGPDKVDSVVVIMSTIAKLPGPQKVA